MAGTKAIILMQPICPQCGCDLTIRRPHTLIQRQVLEYIIDFQSRRGCAPTYAMIGRTVGNIGKSTVAKHVRSLEKQGFLKRDTGAQTFETPEDYKPPQSLDSVT